MTSMTHTDTPSADDHVTPRAMSRVTVDGHPGTVMRRSLYWVGIRYDDIETGPRVGYRFEDDPLELEWMDPQYKGLTYDD